MGAVFVWEGKLLLIQRGKPPAVGFWSIPGGHVEHGESWQDAVEREVIEETALEATCGEFNGWVERESGGQRYLISDFKIDVANPDIAKPGDDAHFESPAASAAAAADGPSCRGLSSDAGLW